MDQLAIVKENLAAGILLFPFVVSETFSDFEKRLLLKTPKRHFHCNAQSPTNPPGKLRKWFCPKRF
jgi:hypothetical protein